MALEVMKCKCGFVAHGKGEAVVHLDRAKHYADDQHFFDAFPDRRIGERRKRERRKSKSASEPQ